MVKFHAYPLPDAGLTQDEAPAHRKRAIESDLASLTDVRVEALEKDVYLWFGCVVPLEAYRKDPTGAYQHLEEAVGMSLPGDGTAHATTAKKARHWATARSMAPHPGRVTNRSRSTTMLGKMAWRSRMAWLRTTARSTALASSRTLPGQS